MGRTSIAAAITAAAVLAAACQRGTDAAAPGATPAGPPADAVTAFFAAITAGSCASLDATVGGGLGREVGGAACAHALDEYRKHGLRLVAVRGATADGRDPHAYLVRVTVARDGRDEDIQVRVEPIGGTWRLTTF